MDVQEPRIHTEEDLCFPAAPHAADDDHALTWSGVGNPTPQSHADAVRVQLVVAAPDNHVACALTVLKDNTVCCVLTSNWPQHVEVTLSIHHAYDHGPRGAMCSFIHTPVSVLLQLWATNSHL